VEGAEQWTLDHRRSLTRHRKQEDGREKEEERKKEMAFQGQARETSEK